MSSSTSQACQAGLFPDQQLFPVDMSTFKERKKDCLEFEL